MEKKLKAFGAQGELGVPFMMVRPNTKACG